MATTHEKELERARRKRQETAAADRRGRAGIIALVVVLVIGVLGLGAVLLQRGGDDAPDDAAAELFDEDEADAAADDAATDETAAGGSMTDPQPAVAEPCPAPSGDLPQPRTEPYESQPSVDLAGVETVTATIETTCGTVELALDAAAAPTTVGNFVALAEDGYYAGVGFHRVINGFMVQGGDPTGTGSGCVDEDCSTRLPGYQFDDELAAAEAVVEAEGGYPRGTIAMANAGPNTNGSQFFIVQAAPGYALPPAYAVFGEVTSGMDVVDRIAQGPTTGDLAVDPVVITSVTIER